MTYQAVMDELRKMGTAQNVKIYKRHGAGDNLFGVSFANLNKLKKKLSPDTGLAVKLWESGNADARCLAAMIADPAEIKSSQANAWVMDISYYLHADMLSGLLAGAPFAAKLMATWMKSKREHVRQCGYNLLAARLKNGHDVSDAECRQYLKVIEREIHSSPNRARHAMNMALIAIGLYRPSLRPAVFEAAGRIGKVEVDHGQTSCKSPDARAYIEKAAKRVKIRK